MAFEQIYNQMVWTRNPEKVEVKGEVIVVTTKPHATDKQISKLLR